MKYFLSFDIGTSFLKSAIFTRNLSLVSPLTVHEIPRSRGTNIVESVKEAFTHSAQKIFQILEPKKNDSLFFCISGNGPTLLYLDKEHRVLHCTPWYSSDYEVLRNEASYYLPFLQYLRKKRKAVFRALHLVIPLSEYLSFLLCNKAATFVPHMPFLDYLWNARSIRKYNFSPALFPSPQISGSVLGTANSNFAKELGLDICKSTVLCGGLDYLSALIGSATVEPNTVCIRGGTSTVINICLDRNRTDQCVELEPDHARFPEFTLSHPVSAKINKGISIPFFQNLYEQSIPALFHLDQEARHIKQFWNFFTACHSAFPAIKQRTLEYKVLLNCITEFSAKKREDISKSISSANPALRKSTGTLSCLLVLLKRIFQQLTQSTNIQTVPRVTLSGGRFKHKAFNILLATMLNTRIDAYNAEYCELRGNVLFALACGASEQRNIEYWAKKHSTPGASYHPLSGTSKA